VPEAGPPSNREAGGNEQFVAIGMPPGGRNERPDGNGHQH
jgi:hypothetical protein